jgi:hypothetical protein
MIRRRRNLPPGSVIIGGTNRADVPRYVAYGVPPARVEEVLWELPSLDLLVTPPGFGPSFLDFDGVVLYAGSFLAAPEPGSPMSALERSYRAADPADLDRREAEAEALLKDGKPVIILVPQLSIGLITWFGTPDSDLFARLLARRQIDWSVLPTAEPVVDALVPEFTEYIRRYGTGYVGYRVPQTVNEVELIATANGAPVGLAVGHALFLLPAWRPPTADDAMSAAEAAIAAVIAYRARAAEIGPLDAREAPFIPPESQTDLTKAVSRLAAGDWSGAVSAACGAVDSVTQALYAKHGLGAPPTPFQVKVNTLIDRLKVWEQLRDEYTKAHVPAADADEIVAHMKAATNSATQALQVIRRAQGDVHGTKLATRRVAYEVIKWASAICGLFHGR